MIRLLSNSKSVTVAVSVVVLLWSGVPVVHAGGWGGGGGGGSWMNWVNFGVGVARQAQQARQHSQPRQGSQPNNRFAGGKLGWTVPVTAVGGPPLPNESEPRKVEVVADPEIEYWRLQEEDEKKSELMKEEAIKLINDRLSPPDKPTAEDMIQGVQRDFGEKLGTRSPEDSWKEVHERVEKRLEEWRDQQQKKREEYQRRAEARKKKIEKMQEEAKLLDTMTNFGRASGLLTKQEVREMQRDFLKKNAKELDPYDDVRQQMEWRLRNMEKP